MTPKERIGLALAHKEADRVAIVDEPWFTTIERWRNEGLPEGVTPAQYFGFELTNIGADISFQLESEVVEETEEYTIVKNADGALVKNWTHKTSTPDWHGFTIDSREKWEEYKPLLAMNDRRIPMDRIEFCRSEHARGQWVNYAGVVGYDRIQCIIGSEQLLVAMAEDPEWAADMYMASADIVIEAAEEMMAKGFVFDGAFIFDDMGYRNTSLFSPRMYRRLLRPAHQKITDFFKGHNMPVVLHSCGCVMGLVPDLIEDGFDCLQPLEVKAGMDLIQLKRDFGDRLAFMGGIDARKMGHPDPSVIEEEIRSKICFAKQGGGYVYSSDHSVPDDVSFEQFSRVVDLVKLHGAYN